MINTPEIEVQELRVLPSGRDLKAFASVRIGDWVIHEWRITQHEGERVQVFYPLVSWKSPDGKVRYRALVSIPAELKQRIDVAILSRWDQVRKNGIPPR